MPRRRTAVALSALFAFGLAACGGGAGDATGSAAATADASMPPATASDTSASPIVADVLDFEAPLLSGGSLDGETLAGRDVAFWFWAPW